jgi:hypothetical protein
MIDFGQIGRLILALATAASSHASGQATPALHYLSVSGALADINWHLFIV